MGFLVPKLNFNLASLSPSLSQGLKRSEQHVLIELFKTKVATTTKGAVSATSEKGLIQPIKKLEKLMRF